MTPGAGLVIEIPAPPLVSTRAELKARRHSWVRIYGRVVEKAVSPYESHYVLKLVVAMPDGYQLSTHNDYLNMRWDQENRSDAITIIGRVYEEPVDGSGMPKLSFVAICQGHVERCGMTRTSQ